MKSYLSYFVLKVKTGLQYRMAAIAGISTQFFFGFMYISIYLAFYQSDSSNLPMEFERLVNYVWLCQAFIAMLYLWTVDKEIINMIKNGDISYELCRPQNLYYMWISKIMGDRVAKVLLRFLPILIICSILPEPFRFNYTADLQTLLLFLISLVLACILGSLLVTFFHIICLYTLDDKGIVNMISVVASFLSGLSIPIPFFPKFLQNITNLLPFRYVTDFTFRLGVGDISINDGLTGILIQIIWIIIIFIISKILTDKALKRVVVQGG